jgi:hypothetical protein
MTVSDIREVWPEFPVSLDIHGLLREIATNNISFREQIIQLIYQPTA